MPIARGSASVCFVSTLMDIEQAAVKLPADQQQQLLRFLLRVIPVAEAQTPETRQFFGGESQDCLAEDETGMHLFRKEQ